MDPLILAVSSSKASILHCIPGLDGGGAERQLALLTNGLAGSGFNVHIACMRQLASGGSERLLASPVHVLAGRSSFDPRLVTRLIGLAREVKAAIIQTWLPQMDVVGGLAARWLGVPHLLTERSSEGAYPFSLRVFARNLVGRGATAIVANSNAGLEYWRHNSRAEFRCVIRNGIYWAPDEEIGIGYENDALHTEGRKLVLFVGRYHPDKRAVELAEALIPVIQKRTDVCALFLGDGPDRKELAALVGRAGVSERMIVGPFASNVGNWMKRAAAFVSISRYEGHPNAVIEAATRGCPLVLSDITAHREMFDSRSAILVRGDSRRHISEGILSAIDDREGAMERASIAKGIVRSFTVQKMVESYIELYACLLSPR